MRYRLTSAGLLNAWEAGLSRRPLDRALGILWAAGVQGDLAEMPLAERDRALIALRAASFGPRIEARAACPACGEELEMSLAAQDLSSAIPVLPEEEIRTGAGRIALRPLTSADLAAAVRAPPEEVARILRARLTGRDDIGEADAAPIDARIEAREAEAELRLRLACAACRNVWAETLDVVALVWAEIEAAALRLLGEIAEIAGAFGWSERDILSLSEPRRHAYLALARRS